MPPVIELTLTRKYRNFDKLCNIGGRLLEIALLLNSNSSRFDRVLNELGID
jgi:hypothetical protein